MKGPGFRYDLDIRRVWECPQCGKRLRYLGHVTSKRCNCNEEGHWMTIVEERVRRTFPKREKIVIPDEEPEETPAEETTSDMQESAVGESTTARETAEPPSVAEISPPIEETPPRSDAETQPSPHPDSETDEPPRRKKRRKRRRRNKSRKKDSEGSTGAEQSSQNSPGSGQGNNPQSDSNDEFGKNVF